jgi:predicted dehydrogenase
VAERYSLNDRFATLDDALRSKWNAAVICTPADTHVRIAQRLADAGLHLLIEKPLSTSTEGIAELRQTVERRQIVAGVAYVYRAHPVLAEMRAAIQGGRFGRPVQVVVSTGQHFPTARPAYREIYYARRASGGGAIQDALTHLVNAAEWIVGPVTRLSADAAHQVLDGVEVEDTVHLVARHGSVMAAYSLNQYQPADEVTLTVNCTAGSARFELTENRWMWITEPRSSWNVVSRPPMERDEWFVRQAELFLDALEGKCAVACTLADALQTLRVNIAALHSADSGGIPVEVTAPQS